MARTVASVHGALTAQERSEVTIHTANYGEAAALRYYGRRLGLPPAVSQHNNFYLWGPGKPEATIVVAVGISPDDLREGFEDVTPVASLTDRFAMPYEREHPVTICRRPKIPLAEAWVQGKKFI